MINIKKFTRGIFACFLSLSLVIGNFAGLGYEEKAEAKTGGETSYALDQLLYWRVDDGAEKPTIRLRTNNVPINFSYTYTDEPELEISSLASKFKDDNPGSKDSYLYTLKNAGVVERAFNYPGMEGQEVLVHKDPSDKDDETLYQTWGYRGKYSGSSSIVKSNTAVDHNGNPMYVSAGSFPDILTEPNMLTYTVNYDGNAILVPVDSIEYYTDVQGEIVSVQSKDNIKLQYAIEKPGNGVKSAKWILGTNITTVRLESDYTYTRLIPITDGAYTENDFIYTTGTNSHRLYQGISSSKYGVYGRIIPTNIQSGRSGTHGMDVPTAYDSVAYICTVPGHFAAPATSHTYYVNEYYNYAYFTSNVMDYQTGKKVSVISNCPVQAVKETVHYYVDVMCYVIDTNTIKGDGKDKTVFFKDYLRDEIKSEAYSFVKNNGALSVKYSLDKGFTVKGISRNTDIQWINGTKISEAFSGYNGELLEWWAGTSSVHNYTTPDRINTDINVEEYMDYGVTLYFMDANKPTKIVKVKIPARSKAPAMTFKYNAGEPVISGLKAGKTAMRFSYPDGRYFLPSESALKLFGDEYLITGESKENEKYGDQSFRVYVGTGDKSKDSTLDLLSIYGLTNNKNFNVIKGAFIELQTIATQKKAASRTSILYVNDQDIFTTGKSSTGESIVLQTGGILISDADANNVYEYCIPDGSGVPTKWTKISAPKMTRVKDLADGTTIYIRRAAIKTNDKSLFLPSSYISLKYNGKGQNQLNAYYMDDLYVSGNVQVNLINDTGKKVEIAGTVLKEKAVLKIKEKSNVIYRNYLEKYQLLVGLSPKSTISVSAGTKTVTLKGIDNTEISLKGLISALKKEYGTEWTVAYEQYGITNIDVDIVGFDSVSPADEARTDLKKTGKSDSGEYVYYPVNLLRYMLKDS